MKTQKLTIDNANAMPAPTWHFLRMNDTRLEIPEGLSVCAHVIANGPWTFGDATAFDRALAQAQQKWEACHPAPTAEELAQREAFLAAEADATYGGTAQSAYQVGADAIEDARSLAVAFEPGVGEEAAAFLQHVSEGRMALEVGPGKQVKAQVLIAGSWGDISVAALDIVAGPRSAVDVSLVVDGLGDASAPRREGVVGTTVRIFADEQAQVRITRTQSLDEGYSDVDDMGIFAAEDAHVTVNQTVLGANKTMTGLAGDLRGDASRIDVNTRYLGRAQQVHDFNYLVRHHGQRTECDIQANGVLAGTSQKTLRGTIDLIRGAKGAQGSENETVLLVDEGVTNKTVPIILCNEDDVAGNHGATIGHIRDEQMFYLASRGLSREAAERMFVSAMLEQAVIDAPDRESHDGVVRLGRKIVPGFADLVE